MFNLILFCPKKIQDKVKTMQYVVNHNKIDWILNRIQVFNKSLKHVFLQYLSLNEVVNNKLANYKQKMKPFSPYESRLFVFFEKNKDFGSFTGLMVLWWITKMVKLSTSLVWY